MAYDSQNVSYESLWQKYRDSNVVNKAREYSRYTLAKLVSEYDRAETDDNSREYITRDFQSVGALLVNNLVARLGEYLFPASARFVKLELKNMSADQRSKQSAVQAALITIEKTIVDKSKQNGGYADLLMTIAHQAVTGNAALYRDVDTGTYRVYGLENFVVQRDGRGAVVDAVIKERIAWDSLPREFQQELERKGFQPKSGQQRCWLYTRVQRVSRQSGFGYEVTQQLGSYQGCVYTPGKDYYPEKVCPWIFPVWSLKSGEHYGRGIVEDHAGDFARLSMLSESSALYMQEALRVLWTLTGGGGNVDDIEQAPTGRVIPLQSGTKLEGIEIGDYNKVQQARDEINQIVTRLAQAFMYTGEFRDSERTTATEVQQVARSAERGLGGPYSMQGKTLQIPLAYVLLAEIDESTVPDIVGNILQLQVVAGLDALGRSIEAETLIKALSDAQAAMVAVANINQVAKGVLDPVSILETIFASNGVAIDDYRKSAEQLAAEGQQIDQAVAAANGVPAGAVMPGQNISQI